MSNYAELVGSIDEAVEVEAGRGRRSAPACFASAPTSWPGATSAIRRRAVATGSASMRHRQQLQRCGEVPDGDVRRGRCRLQQRRQLRHLDAGVRPQRAVIRRRCNTVGRRHRTASRALRAGCQRAERAVRPLSQSPARCIRGSVLSASRLETDVVDSRPQWTAIVHTCEAEPHGLPFPLRKIDGDSSRLAPVCIAG